MDNFSPSSTHITWNIRTKQRSRSINPNFKSLAFRPARITQPNLFTLTPLFPHVCLLPSPTPSPPSRLTIPLFISFHLCLPPRLFHNSLSYYNSFHSINSFSPYFIIPIFHRVLFINHSICSVKVSACFLTLLSLPACFVFELATHSPKTLRCYKSSLPNTLSVLSSYFFFDFFFQI